MNPDFPIRAKQAPRPVWFVLWLALLTILGIWPALTNGQPFFFGDTTAYVRGADLAISNVLGKRFATEWANDNRRAIPIQASEIALQEPSPEANSAQRVVLAGRSIVYGALLYLGALTGGMWFPIIVQSVVSVYLLFLFVVRALRLSFRHFLVSSGVLLVLSPLPFYVSFLMPDIFAAFLILDFAILATSWGRLKNTERTIASSILLFSVLSHTTHLILLVGLTAAATVYVRLTDRSLWERIRPLVTIGTACVMIALLWEAAFSFGVTRVLGTPPVRLPHITAKLVSILDKSEVAQACTANSFAICKFQDQFPVDLDSFLWSDVKHTGVFSVADAQTKRALSQEQIRFALAVVPPNWGRVVSGVFHDVLSQLALFSLGEYYYPPSGLAFFKERLPRRDFDTLTSSVAARTDVYAVLGRRIIYPVTIVAAVFTVVLLSGSFRHDTTSSMSELDQQKIWSTATYIQLGGILLNAIICGGISSANNRYEARVIWLIQLLLTTGICVMWPHIKLASIFKRHSEKNIQVVPS